MKKFMILMASAAVLSSAAQAQIGLAPEIGLNLANMHMKYKDASGADQKPDDGIKLGVKIGANVNIPIGDRLMIQPGLFYSIKGFKSDESTSETVGPVTTKSNEKQNVTLHYFDIPVNFQYMFNDPGEGRFFIGVGPYLAVAFSGKNIYHYDESVSGGPVNFSSSLDTTVKLKFGNDYPSNDYRRFDFGGQVNAGYQLRSGIFFRAMYQQGFTNLIPQGNQDAGAMAANYRSRPTNITISIGKTLGSAPAGRKKGGGGSM